jgi:RND superfamily putative drug exporter
MHARRFPRLARFVTRRPWTVLAIWLVLVLIALTGAWRAESVLHVGQGLPGSDSERVQARLKAEFVHPFTYLAVVTLNTRDGLGDKAGDARRRQLQALLDKQPDVGLTLSWNDNQDATFGKAGDRATFLLVGLLAKSVGEATSSVPRLRATVREGMATIYAQDPTAEAHVTSDTAFNFDLRTVSAQDSARAEFRVIPLTLLLLVVAFGSLVAATLPVAIGMAATLLTLGLVYWLGQVVTLSVFVMNVATMIGLGVGIDYGLFMVSRYRDERAQGMTPAEAAAEAVQTTGPAIVWSGVTVMIGFAAMLIAPLIETRSIGFGGLLEVGICIALALTAVPAALTVIGDRLEWPRPLGVWLSRWQRPDLWKRWTEAVMRHPGRALAAGLLPLLLLAWPATGLKVGIPDNKWMPRSVEAAKGFLALEKAGRSGVLQPIRLIVDLPPGKTIEDGSALSGLLRYAQALQADRRIAQVRCLLLPQADSDATQATWLSTNLPQMRQTYPAVYNLFVNKAQTATLLEVLPANDVGFDAGMGLVRELRQRGLAGIDGLAGGRVTVGGLAAFNLDFHDALLGPFPLIIATVLGVTAVMLFLAFRSWLIPLKAIVLNSLSVAAAFGASVLVFQKGHGIGFFGLAGPTEIIIVVVPVLVFCIVFGLSMDYEVFMLSRIQEEYWLSRDNTAATAFGLQATGRLITSAALIMITVFGAFTFAELLIVKMLGFGLAVAVLLDATLIRVLLVPAIMRLAGRWNWYPGDRSNRKL